MDRHAGHAQLTIVFDEWVCHCTHVYSAGAPIAPEVLALLAPPTLSDPLHPELSQDEVVTAIKRLKSTKSALASAACYNRY